MKPTDTLDPLLPATPPGCLDDAALQSLVDGLLAAPERATAEAHVAGCPHCQGEVAVLRSLIEGLESLEEPSVPLPFIHGVWARIDAAEAQRASQARIAASVLGVATFAAVALFALAGEQAWLTVLKVQVDQLVEAAQLLKLGGSALSTISKTFPTQLSVLIGSACAASMLLFERLLPSRHTRTA